MEGCGGMEGYGGIWRPDVLRASRRRCMHLVLRMHALSTHVLELLRVGGASLRVEHSHPGNLALKELLGRLAWWWKVVEGGER